MICETTRPRVTWYTSRPVDPLAVELLRRAFRRHLKADFRIEPPGDWLADAIRIDNDDALKMYTRGCLDLIHDTIESHNGKTEEI